MAGFAPALQTPLGEQPASADRSDLANRDDQSKERSDSRAVHGTENHSAQQPDCKKGQVLHAPAG
jgi:hypothetical protein